jgi:endonuclease G
VSEAFEEAKRRQDDAAKRRFDSQAAHREANVEALGRPGGIAQVNTAEDIARRLDRVTRYFAGDALPTSPTQVPAAATDPDQVIDVALERATRETAEAAPGVATAAAAVAAAVTRGMQPQTEAENEDPHVRAGLVLEKIINTADFVGIRYLEEGVAASRAVCRLDIRDDAGRDIGYATGSLVSPRLLLTNHHVLPSADVARVSAAEFNYQDGIDGKPLAPQLFQLDPDTFFINDETRDFALVAVDASEQNLAPFGLNRLIEAQGKAIVGDFVTIVQHPRGEKKQIALRDNRIVDELEFFLHYEADTEPGSSGSPVFNDQWEIVALHHASVPTPEHGADTFLNEGIRASRLLRFLTDQQFDGPRQALLDQLRAPERISIAVSAPNTTPLPPSSSPRSSERATSPTSISLATNGGLSWTIPLELAVELRTPSGAPVDSSPAALVGMKSDLEKLVEPYHDEDLSLRKGYDPQFLGVEVPVPRVLDDSLISHLDDGSYVLPYEHFSIVMNKTRRLALFTASNVDASPARKRPETGRDYSRRGLSALGPNDQEKWFVDSRIPADQQLPDRFFTKDRGAFDKGHIVRRDDVAWGDTYDELRRANGDTFHVTNCSPQVANFNRSNLKGVWGELENIVLKQAAAERYCIFAGPVFRDDDQLFSGVDDTGGVNIKIPRQFWKIVIADNAGSLQSFAFLLDQDLSNLEFAVDTAWRTRMVSIADLEKLVAAAEFPAALHTSDQIDATGGETLRAQAGIERAST